MPAGPKRIDELIQTADEASEAGKNFQAERIALKAMQIARTSDEFERMARAVQVLAKARGRRTDDAIAAAAGTITIIDEPFDEQGSIEAGCYLVQPPMVGADARRLRLAAFEQEVPVAVICREPLTQLRETPVVALCPGTTVRDRITSPRNRDNPEFEWFITARQKLGDHAVDSLDPALEPLKRLDALVERMTAIPDHQGIMEALVDACHVALEALEVLEATAAAKAAAGKGRK